jgi:hypothetical protein
MRTRLRIQFPGNREINREFGHFRGGLNSYFDGKYASVLNDLVRDSLRDGTGNFFKRTGSFMEANSEARPLEC